MNIKETVKNCVVEGDFTLHSGESSTWKCDLLKAIDDYNIFANCLCDKAGITYPFGVEFGGALLAASSRYIPGIIRKNGTLYVPSEWRPSKGVCLIDDVTTTGNSLLIAERAILRVYPNCKIVKAAVLDRRSRILQDTVPIVSLVTWEEIMPNRL